MQHFHAVSQDRWSLLHMMFTRPIVPRGMLTLFAGVYQVYVGLCYQFIHKPL